jgi:hypothetical protein
VNGFSGFSNSSNIFSSFSISNPIPPGMYFVIACTDACSLWLTPNASFMYMSARLASFFAYSSSFCFSSSLNLKFSSTTIFASLVLGILQIC